MTAVFCADCGTGCAVLYGREVDPQERDIADAQVWACPSCACSWTRHDPESDTPVGSPAGPETRSARDILFAQAVSPLVEQAPRAERTLATGRVAGYLAAHLGLTRDEGTVDHLDLHQCRQAWRILRAVDYAEVRRWSTQKPKVKVAAASGVAA